MQGKKKNPPKLFYNFSLEEYIPADNFYRILKEHLDLSFVYKETKTYYSHTGRPSLDPVVFFKCMLAGYLENICSDRALERMVQMRLDLKYFIGHDLDDPAPDHSTFCKTRKRLPVEVFEKVFNSILMKCVEAGMVQGKTQSFDTAYINANASLDRMEEVKMVDRDPGEYLKEVLSQDEEGDVELAKKRAAKGQRDLEKFTEMRRKKYSALDGGKKHRKNKRRFLSNATHRSATDPDARVAKKSNKPRMLCYSCMLGVDTEQNVITHIAAEHSSKKDSRLLQHTVKGTAERLEGMGLRMDTVLADAGFSSGENYRALKDRKLKAFIPVHGSFKAEREHFDYEERNDLYVCRNGAELTFTSEGTSGGYLKRRYTSSKKDCDACPFREGCVDKRGIKKIEHTVYRSEYMDMIKRLKSKKGKESYKLRMQTVEPVFGSLQQYYGLRWISTRGIKSANKLMLMAGAAFNLKKWVKYLVENGLFPDIWAILSPGHQWCPTTGIVIFGNIFFKDFFDKKKVPVFQAF
jgi:transposase